jgi:protein TonB
MTVSTGRRRSAGSAPVIETTSIAVKRRIDPLYPPSARRQDQEGTVRVRILVDERGRASDVQVTRSSGYDSLDDAAVSAVRRWQFIPATENSRAVSAWTEVSVVFRLD